MTKKERPKVACKLFTSKGRKDITRETPCDKCGATSEKHHWKEREKALKENRENKLKIKPKKQHDKK